MNLTWKDPSDNGGTKNVVPVQPASMENFFFFHVEGFTHLSTLHVNSLKANGEYLPTQEMKQIVQKILKERYEPTSTPTQD
jgi:hypothetical protein